jgi:cyanophycinase-like exopeptidase
VSAPTRAFGLLGSGEFLPWSSEVDRRVLRSARPTTHGFPTVLIVPSASAPEGDAVFDDWGRRGLEHFRSNGIVAKVLPLKRREDALNPDIAEPLRHASLVYLSGGNPAYLSRILAETPFWQMLVEELDRGLGYVGCSAGVACLGSRAPDSAAGTPTAPEAWTTGLELFPRTMFGPHWDRLDVYVPGLRDWFVGALPPGHDLVAIDEETALVGDGARWEVVGRGGVSIHRAIRDTRGPEVHPAGSRVDWKPPAL